LSADEVIAASVRRCFEIEHAATVPEKRLVAEALATGVGSVTAEEIRRRLPAHGITTRNIGGQLLCSMTEARDRHARRRAGPGLAGGDRRADADHFHDHVMHRQQLDAQELARASHVAPVPTAPPPLHAGYGR